ncbi:MAG TPA: class I SAM-dependent methyltransferase [Bacilli bacterium]
MIITTSRGFSPELEEEAVRMADKLGAVWVPRQNVSLHELLAKADDHMVLLLARGQWKLYRDGAAPLFFHPSSAMLRIKRLLQGGADPLLTACAIAAGDSVLDCTAGLCSDAIVFAYAVGAQGTVEALESEPVLAELLAHGVRRYVSGQAAVDQAMRRVRVTCADHCEVLASLPDNSRDIVYFDPMFRTPIAHSQAISPLRGIANDRPLSREAVCQAVRVAKRRVVLKEQMDSGEFARLGFSEIIHTSSKIAYGVMKP